MKRMKLVALIVSVVLIKGLSGASASSSAALEALPNEMMGKSLDEMVQSTMSLNAWEAHNAISEQVKGIKLDYVLALRQRIRSQAGPAQQVSTAEANGSK